MEFNGCVLGDSQKLDVPVDKDVVYSFTCSFECSEGAHTLDDVAHKPVIREDFCLVFWDKYLNILKPSYIYLKDKMTSRFKKKKIKMKCFLYSILTFDNFFFRQFF